MFTPAYKAEAVRLVHVGDRSVGEVAKALDLTATALREWTQQAAVEAVKGPLDALTTARVAIVVSMCPPVRHRSSPVVSRSQPRSPPWAAARWSQPASGVAAEKGVLRQDVTVFRCLDRVLSAPDRVLGHRDLVLDRGRFPYREDAGVLMEGSHVLGEDARALAEDGLGEREDALALGQEALIPARDERVLPQGRGAFGRGVGVRREGARVLVRRRGRPPPSCLPASRARTEGRSGWVD